MNVYVVGLDDVQEVESLEVEYYISVLRDLPECDDPNLHRKLVVQR